MSGKPKVTGKLTEEDHGLVAFLDQLDILRAKPFVKIGVIGSGKARIAKETISKDGGTVTSATKPPTNVEIATWQEYGTTHIPERSFIRSTVFENRERYLAMMDDLKNRILQRKMSAHAALEFAGLRIQADIKNKIRNGDSRWQKLARSTLLARARNTAANSVSILPLIDTGQLMNSITYQVVLGGKKKGPR